MENNNNTLAKIALAISAVLMILVIILFTKLPSSNTGEEITHEVINENDSNKVEIVNQPKTNIAFFNMDSLGSKLDLFKEIETGIEEANKNAERKMKNKQAEITAWEKKWASKGKLLSTEEQQYMKEAQQMQQDAMQFEQRVQMELARKQDELMLTYATRVSNHCKEFGEKNGYDAVMAYTFGQNVWYYNPGLDITDQLANQMNAAFAESTGKTEEETAE